MKLKFILTLLFLIIIESNYAANTSKKVFIEAESFSKKGGWVVDQQFIEQMGSSYLMAHGMGIPVEDASTIIHFPQKGVYHLYVRCYNWTAPWSKLNGPGKFLISINGDTLSTIVGDKGNQWEWQYVGKIDIKNRTSQVSLHDITGFNGRCDALYFTTQENDIPPTEVNALRAWKTNNFGTKSIAKKHYDLVVVGGGIAGICTAVSAARLGIKVALIHNRPVLGGNNSSEVRVHLGGRIRQQPYPEIGNLVNELGPMRIGNAQPKEYYEDEKKWAVVKNEKNIDLYCNYHAYEITKSHNLIQSIKAKHIESGKIIECSAPIYCDCTGDGSIGYMAGVKYMMGTESKNEFNESKALEKASKMTMGSSVQWYAKTHESAQQFPIFNYGIQFCEESAHKIRKGEWTWETGMNYNQIDDFERIRDYGLLVIYSNWSFLKNESKDKNQFSNDALDWVAYIAGKRESRRLIGQHILTQNDILNQIKYEDGCVSTTWTIDLHYPDRKNTEFFPGNEFISYSTHTRFKPYLIPYRCLYTKDIANLFMAGRNISVTHIALGTTRVMRTTGMMGEVVGIAAYLCKKYKCMPHEIYTLYLNEFKELLRKGVGNKELENTQTYNLG